MISMNYDNMAFCFMNRCQPCNFVKTRLCFHWAEMVLQVECWANKGDFLLTITANVFFLP